jgi:hypothetical protein
VDKVEVLDRVESCLKGVSTDVKTPTPVPAGATDYRDVICFVIPHRDRGVEAVERCLRQLTEAGGLTPQDRVVVADQTAESELKDVCSRYGAGLVVDTAPPEVWNPARCRNQAVRVCPEADYYAPVDVDCLVPPGYAEDIRNELAEDPWRPLTPLVRFADEDLSVDEMPWVSDWPGDGREAPGAGMTVYPRHVWYDSHGMDEEFTRWGSEDTDLLWRVRMGTGVEAKLLDEVVVYHCPHKEQKDKKASGKQNLDRLNRRMAGELGLANPDGWGQGGRVVLYPQC